MTRRNQQEEMGRLSQAMETLGLEMRTVREKLDTVTEFINQQKGAYRMMLIFSSTIGAIIGAVSTSVFHFFIKLKS